MKPYRPSASSSSRCGSSSDPGLIILEEARPLRASPRQARTPRISNVRCADLTRQNSLVGEIMMSPTGNWVVGAVYDRPRSCNWNIVGGHRPPLQFGRFATFLFNVGSF